jgi:hypothetical protein
VEIRGI